VARPRSGNSGASPSCFSAAQLEYLPVFLPLTALLFINIDRDQKSLVLNSPFKDGARTQTHIDTRARTRIYPELNFKIFMPLVMKINVFRFLLLSNLMLD